MAKIPKIIHYCWVGGSSKPKSVQYCIESWKKYCPDYEIKEWNESNYDFTKNIYMKEAYDAKKWGFVPDYARLDIVYEHGGIYLDTDVEIIKNFDELLECDAFFGFENTGDGEMFVNCGHGFGACKHNEFIKQERDEYNNVHFINADGTLNMMPSPHYTTKVLCGNGLIRKNIDQNIKNIKIYASDVLCPKNFRTGKLKITSRTVSIHHFTASWLEDSIKKEMLHQQKIKNMFGEFLGYKVLYLESVIKKYDSISMMMKIPTKLFTKLKHKIITVKDNYIYNKYLQCTQKAADGEEDFIILDTFMDSDNQGDGIIMENCLKQLSDVMNTMKLKHVPTHRFLSCEEEQDLKNSKGKILCGTNILSGHMKTYGLWKLKPNVVPYKNTILMGVGFDSPNNDYDEYTKKFFDAILSKDYIHSVRDSFSEKKLKNMGIKNVINTGCPTMWGLTPEHCKQIPMEKANNVICTITDYNQDIENDKLLLNILIEHYQKVYLWLQGEQDLDYVKSLDLNNRLILIPPKIEEYDKILRQDDLDYVGTRLHAGIRALAFKHRTIVISIDNRAEAVSHDTGLPIVYRNYISEDLVDKIHSKFESKIILKTENIDGWKKQF